MLNIVVPMAGRGKRFAEAGITVPKPLIPVRGKPMISVVIDNIRPRQPHQFVFLCLEEHLKLCSLERLLRTSAPGCLVLPVQSVTEGAACTVLGAAKEIDNDAGLMIANCDQWVDVDIEQYLEKMQPAHVDGLIMTMHSRDPKWSYVRLDAAGLVIEVVEKQVVSDQATVGIYNFKRGSDFVWAAQEMIKRDLRVNGEFYVAPVYNQLIAAHRKIVAFNVGAESSGMHGLGIPADLEAFERLAISDRVLTTRGG